MALVGVMGCKSRYNNGLIAKLISIFANMEERREEREESLAPTQTPNWARIHRHLWAQTKIYVKSSTI
jgi:hypothetical protein